MPSRHATVLVGTILVTCLLFGLAACGGTHTPTIEVPTVLPTPVVFATKTPAPSVAEIMISAQTSPYLDHVHLTNGLTCQSCHDSLPPTSTPTMALCLSCHGGTYAAVAAKTTSIVPNPHASHRGEEPCTSCHRIHAPFEYMCTRAGCHTDLSYTGRFAAP
jgi:hypothetical protein